MTVEFILQAEDVSAYQRQSRAVQKRLAESPGARPASGPLVALTVLFLWIASLTGAIVCSIILAITGSPLWYIGTALWLFLAGSLLYFTLRADTGENAVLSRELKSAHPIIIRLEEAGVTVVGKHHRQIWDWSSIDAVLNLSGIVAVITNDGAVIVPDRAFEDPLLRSQFIERATGLVRSATS